MKKFDLEAAKNGAAVCLRDGTPAKILDFQFHFPEGDMILYKYYDRHLCSDIESIAEQTGTCIKIVVEEEKARMYDLFMAPVYAYATIYLNRLSKELYSGKLCSTEEIAKMQKDNVYPDMEKFGMARIELLQGGEND